MDKFIECRVIMLSTGKKEYKRGDIIVCTKPSFTIDARNAAQKVMNPIGTIRIADYDYMEKSEESCTWQAQHLYFTTDEEIKEYGYGIINHPKRGLNIMSNHVVPTTEGNKMAYDFWKAEGKIGASTDPSLSLPLIPHYFKEQYVKEDGKIDRVSLKQVEKFDITNHFLDNNTKITNTTMNNKNCQCGTDKHSCPYYNYDNECTYQPKLKLTCNNEVIILDEPINLKNVAEKLKDRTLFPNQVEDVKGKIIASEYKSLEKIADDYLNSLEDWQGPDYGAGDITDSFIAGWKSHEKQSANEINALKEAIRGYPYDVDKMTNDTIEFGKWLAEIYMPLTTYKWRKISDGYSSKDTKTTEELHKLFEIWQRSKK